MTARLFIVEMNEVSPNLVKDVSKKLEEAMTRVLLAPEFNEFITSVSVRTVPSERTHFVMNMVDPSWNREVVGEELKRERQAAEGVDPWL